MDCNLSYDNRETCTVVVPSSCVPYVGYISEIIVEDMPECKPNINDVIKSIQLLLERMKASLGDNTTLDEACLDIDPALDSQKTINQTFINEICTIKDQIALLGGAIDISILTMAVDLLCLEDPSCDPQPSYTLLAIIEKLIAAYCDLLDRVTNIETILNI